MLAFSIGSSRLLERYDAGLAVTLFPLNTDAVVRQVAGELDAGIDAGELPGLKARVEDALRYDRVDARLFSLLGEIDARLGDRSAAALLSAHAYRLSQTDRMALQQRLVGSIEQGRPADAVRYLDILLRRWPNRLADAAPILPALLSNPEGYASIIERLTENPPWRRSLIASLARDPAMGPMAGKLLLDLQAKAPVSPWEIAAAVQGQLSQRRYAEAYRLFLFTLNEDERRLAGYVFNGDFAPIHTKRAFDWRFDVQSGVEITGPAGAGAGQSGVTIRFLNKPVKAVGMQQQLSLPPGEYRLVLEASADDLKLPKQLYWRLLCVDPVTGAGKLEVPEGTYERTKFETRFSVGSENCPAQVLRLETGVVAESWRNRYSGTLVLHGLHIEKAAPL